MNQLTRMPIQQDGWFWDGNSWIWCGDSPPPCPPPSTCPPPTQLPPVPCPPFGPPVFSGPVGQPPWYPGANGGVSFGTVPPPNPVRGHFWYDGTTLWLFDGAAWNGVDLSGPTGGGGTGTTPPVIVPSGPTPPLTTTVGSLWYSGTGLYVWSGTAWVPVSQTKTYLQAGQPGAANPGDLWFDGTALHVYSGTAWVLVGPTPSTGPGPGTGGSATDIIFQMQQTTGLNPSPASGWAIIPYSSPPLEDTQGAWNPVTHRFTPTVAGVYYVSCRVNAGVGCGIAVAKNDDGGFTGARTSDIVPAFASIAAAGWVVANGMVDMNGTSDFVRPWTNHGGTIPNAGSNPVFIITKMP